MRTLTPTAITKKDARTWDVDWLLESPFINLHLSYGYEGERLAPAPGMTLQFPGPRDFAWDLTAVTDPAAATWEHRYLGIGEIEQSIPPGGGIGAVSSLQVELVEDGTGQSLLSLWNQYERLEGQPLYLSLLFAGENYSDRILLWGGEIEKAGWRNDRGRLLGVDNTLPSDLLLPRTLITTQGFPSAPEQAINQALPIFYGSGEPGRLELAPLILVDGERFNRYRASEHPLASMSPLVGLFPPGAKAPLSATVPSATAATAEVILNAAITTILWGGHGISGLPAISRALDVANPLNALDGNTATLAVIGTSLFLDANGDGDGQLGLKLTYAAPEGANMASITLAAFRRGPNSRTTVAADIRLRTLNEFNEVAVDGLWHSPTYRHVSNPRTETFNIKPISLDAGSSLEALVDVKNEGGRGTADDTFEIGEFSVSLGYQPDSPLEPVYLDGARSAQFSGRIDLTGAITGGSIGRIDNPADVIRSVFVDEMYRMVNGASFDAARTALAGWVFDGGVGAGWSHDRIDARQWLDDMTRMCRCYLIPDGQGSFELLPFDTTPATVHDLTQDNIVAHVTDPSGQAANWDSSFDVDTSDMALVFNDITVRYAWNPATRQFAKTAFATPSGSNHSTEAANLGTRMADSVARYKEKPPLVLDAYMISQQATAERLLKALTEYHWSQHCIVTCDTTLAACHVKVGDWVTVTHPKLPELINGLPFEVLRMRFQPSQGTITLVCMRQMALSFQYFAIKDQAGETWYWWINHSGGLAWTSAPPGTPTRSAQDLNLTPIPYWIQLTDPAAATRFVYPNLLGAPVVQTTAPAVGTGMVGSPVVNGLALGNWRLAVNRLREVYAERL